MELAKDIARQFFTKLGFHVGDIPEGDAKRADLDVNDGLNRYVIEVKETLDTGGQVTVLSSSCPNSDVKITREPHAASNLIDGILKRARKQLAATPADEAALRLVFLFSKGPSADMFVRRSLYTFYGVENVVPVSGNGLDFNCVYFHNSFSFSSQNVDGLLLVENQDLLLCLNEFSARCDVLRRSQLAQRMGMAVLDPAKFDDDPRKIVLRSTISRANEITVLDELERISGVRYRTFLISRYNFG